MGAALSEALIPVWREPVTITSSKSLSPVVGVTANTCAGHAATAQSSATPARKLRGRASSRLNVIESISHPFMFVA
jgi:hypothetical protein